MAASQSTIYPVAAKSSPMTEEDCRKKADFDSSMAIIRHLVRFADREAGEYFFRELVRETRSLSKRYGLKTG